MGVGVLVQDDLQHDEIHGTTAGEAADLESASRRPLRHDVHLRIVVGPEVDVVVDGEALVPVPAVDREGHSGAVPALVRRGSLGANAGGDGEEGREKSRSEDQYAHVRLHE